MKNLKSKIPDKARLVFKGKIFSVWQWEQEMFDGSVATYEVVSRNNSTSVIAVTEDKKIIVNYEEQPHIGSFISIPGGMGEDGLSEIENAKKELKEESGYVSDKWELWDVHDVLDNSKIQWNSFTFIARDCVKKFEAKLDPGERIETKILTFDEFVQTTQMTSFRNKSIKNYIKNILNDKDQLDSFRNFILS